MCRPTGEFRLTEDVFDPGVADLRPLHGIQSLKSQTDLIELTAPLGQIVPLDQVEEALRANPDTKLVGVVHAETSTGVRYPVASSARSSAPRHPRRCCWWTRNQGEEKPGKTHKVKKKKETQDHEKKNTPMGPGRKRAEENKTQKVVKRSLNKKK